MAAALKPPPRFSMAIIIAGWAKLATVIAALDDAMCQFGRRRYWRLGDFIRRLP